MAGPHRCRWERRLQLAGGVLAFLVAAGVQAAPAADPSGAGAQAVAGTAADSSGENGFAHLRHAVLSSRLVAYSMSLLHARYRYGGSNPATGIDCSGFVRHVYLHTAGVALPHNARAMSEEGARISKRQLRPGDLVFFKTIRNAVSHVGIYIGDNLFIHAENHRKGVNISALDNSYWRRHFQGAQRILTHPLWPRRADAEANAAVAVSARSPQFNFE